MVVLFSVMGKTEKFVEVRCVLSNLQLVAQRCLLVYLYIFFTYFQIDIDFMKFMLVLIKYFAFMYHLMVVFSIVFI